MKLQTMKFLLAAAIAVVPASATTVYLQGSFGTGGSIPGGTFSGSFNANLPYGTSYVSLSTFDIFLQYGGTTVEIKNGQSGSYGSVFANNETQVGALPIQFSDSHNDLLVLYFALPFTGSGPVLIHTSGGYAADGILNGGGGTILSSGVASLVSLPEPSTWFLTAFGLLAALALGKRAHGMKAMMILTGLVLVGAARGDTLYINGTPDATGNSGGLGIENWEGATSFNLFFASTVEGAEFAVVQGTTNNDVLTWSIYGGGANPGALIATGTNPAVATTRIGGTSLPVLLYDINLNAPVALASGQYWLAFTFAGSSYAEWDVTTQYRSYTDGRPIGGSWNENALSLYLSVSSTPLVTPEPGTAGFLAVGLFGIAVRSGVRKSRRTGLPAC